MRRSGQVGPVALLPDLQRRLIPRILERVKGNQVKAAQILGISRNTLRGHLRPPEEKP
ncbi:hypothetical protein HS125_09485 [bacterium]|nr:hypothetical protein [bacterium]